MRDINIANRDVNVENRNILRIEKPWIKIVLSLIALIGVIVTALLGSQWLPQIWDKIKGI